MAGQLTKPTGNGLRSIWASPLMRRDLGELLDRLWAADLDWGGISEMSTSMDLSETDQGYRATLDLPGVKVEDIEIQVNGNSLTVSGERKEETEEKGRTYHRTERSVGRFSRSITLPCDVIEDKVSAEMDEGVLTIELPKAKEAQPRKIKVKG